MTDRKKASGPRQAALKEAEATKRISKDELDELLKQAKANDPDKGADADARKKPAGKK